MGAERFTRVKDPSVFIHVGRKVDLKCACGIKFHESGGCHSFELALSEKPVGAAVADARARGQRAHGYEAHSSCQGNGAAQESGN